MKQRIVLLCHPIHTGRLGHAVPLDKRGVGEMRATAQINEWSAFVKGDCLLLGNLSDDLLLEFVVLQLC